MKRKLLGIAAAIGLLFSIVPAALAAPAYTTPWQVSITYQNVGTASATISIDFFAENSGTPINIAPPALPAGASSSLSVSSVSGLTSGFKGSAVLSSDQPVIATIVQVDSSGVVKNRPLSNGFSASDGSAKQLVATVLKNQFGNTTTFAVQNTETSAIDVTVQYFAVGSTTPTHTATATNLPANASKYFDAGTITELGSSFNGSAIVTAKLAGSSTDARVVVTANEFETAGPGSKAFEGSSLSGSKVFMASALCNFAGSFSTAYAVQNASLTDSVTFQVTYKLSTGDVVDGPFTLSGGGKQSILGCNKLASGAIGSAIIERTAGTGTLVAVGKVSGGNITSAFLGAIDGTGSAKVALPYIRWSPDSTFNGGSRQRAFVAVQNIGTANATNVRVQYIDKDGVLKGEHNLGTIAPGAKISSNPSLATGALDSCGRFGEYGGGADCLGTSFGGGALVIADTGAQLAVIVRIQSGNPTLAGEDYSGINVQ